MKYHINGIAGKACMLLVVGIIAFNPLRSQSSPKAFIASLAKTQKEKALKDFDHERRMEWHFLPGAMWPRPGLPLTEMDADQKELFFTFLSEHLSQNGYRKVKNIIELENVLRELGGNPTFRDPDKYHVVFYGNPLTDDHYAWSFEGHHISLNFTIIEEDISMTPRFLGANPAIVPSGTREGLRVLEKEETLAFDLMRSMSAEQRAIAVFSDHAYFDIVTSNASEVSPLRPVGIPMKSMRPQQKDILWELIRVYLSNMPERIAADRKEEIMRTEADDIRFGWAGSMNDGEAHYYRVQGDTFLIEFDNAQNGANHIHTIWRDFDGDFGRDLLREHYLHSGHR